MKPFLYFPCGCEFEYSIHEKNADFNYFYRLEHHAEEQQQIKPYPEWFLSLQPDIEKAPVLSA